MSLLLLPPMARGGAAVSNLFDAAFAAIPGGRESMGFDVCGQVVAFEDRCALVRDGTFGTRIRLPAERMRGIRVGDVVRLAGTGCDNRINRRELQAESVEVLRHAALPEPRRIDGQLLSAGKFNYLPVRVDGVVAGVFRDELDSRWNWFILRTPSASVYVAASEADHPLASLRALADAEISATGISLPFHNWRASFGNHLQLTHPGSIAVVKPPPEDPFAVPALGVAPPTMHRQRVSGLVVASAKDIFYLHTQRHSFIRVQPGTGVRPPANGESVDVSGFARRTAGGVVLYDALTRPSRSAAMQTPPPDDIDPQTLFVGVDGVSKIESRHNGRIVRLRGIVRAHPKTASFPASFLLECKDLTFTVDMSSLAGSKAPEPRFGSLAEVTGLCVADFQEDALGMRFPHFRGFVLVPRTPSDIRILANPPWWTPFRLFVFICILIVALVAVGIWNRLLHAHSERRGRELYRERIAHAQAEFKVEERTRLAVELHDSISQTLAGVALQIDSAERASRSHGDADGFLRTARQLLASCRREFQSSLWDLRSRTFEERDMTEIIERAVTPHAGDARIKVRFNVPREQLLETTTHAILRIIRELVSNSARHGLAKTICIAGEHCGDTVSFSVSDDGCGFDVKAAPGPMQGHFGLQGIRERLKPFSGTIDIKSAPGAGTRATIRMVIREMSTEKENEEEDQGRPR